MSVIDMFSKSTRFLYKIFYKINEDLNQGWELKNFIRKKLGLKVFHAFLILAGIKVFIHNNSHFSHTSHTTINTYSAYIFFIKKNKNFKI